MPATETGAAVQSITANLGWFKIIVSDMERAVDFYVRALGLTVTRTIQTPTLTEKLLCSPGMENGPFIVLYRHEEDPPITIGNGWGPVGFFVPDVDRAYSHALACGAKPSVEPYETEGLRIAFVLDPEGHEIELASLPSA